MRFCGLKRFLELVASLTRCEAVITVRDVDHVRKSALESQ